MNTLYGILLSLSILSLLYYCLITLYAGNGTTFSWFWITAGTIGLLLSCLFRYLSIHNIEMRYGLPFLIAIIIAIGLGIFALIEVIIISHANKKAEIGLDFIIILGAQVKGTRISKTLLKRLDTAEAYLRENTKTIAIVSGGKGEKEAISEADAMSDYLIGRGISGNRIMKEDKSKNTFENILYCKTFIKTNSSVAIVTNGFHLFRSISIAKKQGINQVQGLAAPTDRILAVNYYTREAVGVLKDRLLGNI